MGFSSHPRSVLLLLFIYSITIITCADILPGSTLFASDLNKTWSSPNNTFSLGFIPSTAIANTFTAAISYGGIPIWEAGGPATSVDSAASLQFLSSGNLRLVNGSGSTIWQSNTSDLGVSVAALDDSGNLVLKNGSISVWSTFDNPTDTIVPSQNFSTSRVLGNGIYSFSLVSSGNLTLTWNDDIMYWTLGLNSSFDVNLTSPSLGIQPIGTLTISDQMLPEPVIMAYSSDYDGGGNILRFLKLDSDGNLRIYSSSLNSGTSIATWSAVLDQCEVYGYCGNLGICSYNYTSPICDCPSKNFDLIDPNDSRKGCKRKVEINDCVGNEVMLELDHAKFLTYPPETSSQVFFMGMAACRSNCLESKPCNASTSLADGTGWCYSKTTDYISGYQSPSLPSTSYVKVCGPVVLNPSPYQNIDGENGGLKLHVWVIVVVVVSTLLGLIALEVGLWWCFCYRRMSSKFGGLAAQYALLEYASGAPVQFSFKQLQKCTKVFKEKLGEGGFGAVYKGSLLVNNSNRTIVAVKQLEGIEQGEKQFRMEVATISSTHHLNLVRLIGFCSEGRHRLLVYEFMKNGSLDNFLFNTSTKTKGEKTLTWKNRFKIALGTAKGITYLHEECRDCIIHCDIKPENILLDENYNAKVSDFGLAKLTNPKDHRYKTIMTSGVRGTRGYLAPEWLANHPITSKSDVYSYGMVLLEIVGGKRNFEVSGETNGKKFSTWAIEEFEKSGNINNVVDKRLLNDDNEEVDMEQVKRVVQVSFLCIQEQSSRRPTMGKVVQMLEGVTEILNLPVFTHQGSVSSNFEGLAPPPSSSAEFSSYRSSSTKNQSSSM